MSGHRLVPGEWELLRAIDRGGSDPAGVLADPIFENGGRKPNRLRNLLAAGYCELYDHPTEVEHQGKPARTVRITNLGRIALTQPTSQSGSNRMTGRSA